ncbi:MAG: EAL domain-containing protein [Marinobacter sp.]|nr:EAL domain-containing protein [Marinobacter sp.]
MNQGHVSRSGGKSQVLADVYVALSTDPELWRGGLDPALRRITHCCAEALAVERVSVWRLNDARDQILCLMLYQQASGNFDQGACLELSLLPDYFAGLSLGRFVDVPDVYKDRRTRLLVDAYFRPEDIHSMLDATVRLEGDIVGLISLESVGHARLWTADEQHFLASIADLVSQLMAVCALRSSESRYRALFEGTGDAVFVVKNGVFTDCNPAAESMFQVSREDMLNLNPALFSPPYQPDGEDSATLASQWIEKALEEGMQCFEWQHCRSDGSEFDAEVTLSRYALDGEICVIGAVRDITRRRLTEQELARSREQLEYRANHDSLTGLPNRNCLHEDTLRIIKETGAADGLAYLLLDLDRFKEVNDTLGHSVGDRLLAHIGTHLIKVLAPYDATLYRLGGDEFVVVAQSMPEVAQVMELADTITLGLRTPITVEGISLELGASIGVARYPQHADNSHGLLRCADVAMYHAKQSGLGATVYDASYDSYSPRRLALMSELGAAIREDQLELHFQPRVDLRTGHCNGCEALLRWRHPEQGMVPPGDFIPAAEMSDVIHPLSQWVVKSALQHVRRWLDAGTELSVAVNLSARNLIDMRCPGMIADLLRQYAVPPRLLEIEITESALITDPERALEVLRAFRTLGLRMAIDDFGTGYSSLSYLKRLPIDTLKIDRSFVQDMLTDEADAVIVRSTIGLAHSFGLKVVAEGVEEEEVLTALAALQCDQAQGFHIAKPLPLDEFEGWLQRHMVGHADTSH